MVQKTLFSAMERVINMMREVELQEKAAEEAKQEASRGGLNILVEVEDLKQTLVHAKEANNMVVKYPMNILFRSTKFYFIYRSVV